MVYCPQNYGFCKTLQSLSTNVWHDLQDAEDYNSPIHEESITQYNSLKLNRKHAKKNRVHQFKKHQEKRNGADWLWLFYDPGTLNYVGAAVQAKRLYSSGQYDVLKLDQAKKLINYTNLVRQNGIVPLYVFYNYPKIRVSRPDFYRRLNRLGPFRYLDPPADLGCTFMPARRLIHQGILRSTKPFDLSKDMRPWWHLACKCPMSRRPPSSPDDGVNRIANFIQTTGDVRERPDDFIDPRPAEGPFAALLKGEELPDEKLEHMFGLDEIDRDDPDAFDPKFVRLTEVVDG